MSATALTQLSRLPEPTGREQYELQASLSAGSEERLLLTVAEAAQRLGIGRTLMYELLGTGQIKSIHVGRLHKVPVSALRAFVERQCEL